MKLKQAYPLETKNVDYFGIQLTVLGSVEYLATDEDGLVCAYDECPRKDLCAWLASRDNPFYTPVAIVDLEDMDWKDTLVEV
ncbi:hypothetical protein [Photorhabdus temperata]|uniref:Uncharacterized protein n=1 Tax=Photorhabdus temperata J3 TaxID=1389415 RepID=U7R2C6_PHOTE|nr:hypothetical protein [Photorhabdus temperata]ERT13447.1 hypothetical protein O185_08730 [Photorhabdus temperata J3]